jgi:hypothetical protein
MTAELWVTHSLDKVFPDTEKPPKAAEVIALKAARNETEDAQVVVRLPRGVDIAKASFAFTDLVGERGRRIPKQQLSAWWVWYTPVTHNPPENRDPATYLRQAPALFPDAFLESKVIPIRDDWTQPLWVSVKVPKGATPGEYHGTLSLTLNVKHGGKSSLTVPITLTVWPFTLPDKSQLHHTEWHYTDLLAAWYHLVPWSEAHWAWIEKMAADMGAHKQDMILTPFTEFVKVTQTKSGQLSYDFSQLDRWIRLFRKHGVDLIEGGHIAHRSAGWEGPIVWTRFPVYVESGQKLDTAKLSEEEWEPYLEGLLKAVHAHLKRRGWAKQYVQHVADEPIPENEASWCYRAAKVKAWLPGVPRIDAVMSHGLEGYVDIRVPQIQHTGPEVKRNPRETLWSYVCLAPQGPYPNRFLDYPSIRNRIIFWLSWSLGLKGFLHWGYNYWGRWQDMPEEITVSPWMDATGASIYRVDRNPLPAGDAFLVYPGKKSICSSIRWEVIRKGIEDYEYLRLLERAAARKTGPKAAAAKRLLAKVKSEIASDPRGHTRDEALLLSVREQIGELLAELG